MPRQPVKKLLIILGKEPAWRLLYNHGRVTWAHIRQPRGVSGMLIWPPTRYLRAYMGRTLTHQMRREIVLSQVTHLEAHVHRSFFIELAHPRDALWRHADERCCSIWLSANPGRHLEGDFDLVFQLDGVAIYSLSFSIGPNLAHPAAGEVAMLVGRVQGERGHFGDIRLATKALSDISPAALLVSAAEGIALIKGAKNPALAKRLIDWATSPAMQGQFAKYKINFVPAHPDVALEPSLAAVLKDAKLFPIDADYAGANRKRIVDRWVAEVLNP